MTKGVRIVLGFLMAIGLVFFAAGSYSVWRVRQFIHNAASADGTVIYNIWRRNPAHGRRSSMRVYPQVRFYTPAGKIFIFQSTVGSGSRQFELKQPVRVLYDPRDPDHASIDTFGQLWSESLLLFVPGLVLSAPLLSVIARRRFRARTEVWLQQNGRRIQADTTLIAPNTSYSVNGVHPYQILCQWRDPISSRTHLFFSDDIWYDPSKFIHGKTIEVLVDPANPRRYSVQTPFLPKVE